MIRVAGAGVMAVLGRDRVGRRWVLGAIAGLAVAGAAPIAASAGETFRQEVATLLHRRRPTLKFSLPADPETIDVKAGGNTLQVYLGNLQRQIGDDRGAPRERQILEFFDRVSAVAPADGGGRRTWAQARANLRIQIVPIEYRQQATGLIVRDLTGKVVIAYAHDQGQRYALVTQDDLKSWGVGADAVHAAALAGLAAASTKLPVTAKRSADRRGAYATIATNDGYDAARLLVPSVRQKLRKALGSDRVIVAIPNRDFLVAWTPDFSERADFAAKAGEDSRSRSHPLTDELFVVDANGVRIATATERAEQRRI